MEDKLTEEERQLIADIVEEIRQKMERGDFKYGPRPSKAHDDVGSS